MKMLNLLTARAAMLLVLCLSLLTTSCDENEPRSSSHIDITDPDEVAKSVIIEDATFIKSNMPAPTAHASSPVIDENLNDIPLISIQGSRIIVHASLESGSAAGFFVQVNGSSGYYKVTSTITSGRKTKSRTASRQHTSLDFAAKTQADDDASFSLEIPDNINPGVFCITYSVFDAQNRVSNTVEQCVTVHELGGSEASFITKNLWQLEKAELFINDVLDDADIVGTPTPYTDTFTISCDGSTKFVQATETYTTNFSHLTFAAHGAFAINSEYSLNVVDYENSNCEVVYEEMVYTETANGAWSFHSQENKLIVIYNIENVDGVLETHVNEYTPVSSSEQLILTTTDTPDEFVKYTLEPKIN